MPAQEVRDARPRTRAIQMTARHHHELGLEGGCVETPGVSEGNEVVVLAVEQQDRSGERPDRGKTVEPAPKQKPRQSEALGGVGNTGERRFENQRGERTLARQRADRASSERPPVADDTRWIDRRLRNCPIVGRDEGPGDGGLGRGPGRSSVARILDEQEPKK